jgi:hypothetical protein
MASGQCVPRWRRPRPKSLMALPPLSASGQVTRATKRSGPRSLPSSDLRNLAGEVACPAASRTMSRILRGCTLGLAISFGSPVLGLFTPLNISTWAAMTIGAVIGGLGLPGTALVLGARNREIQRKEAANRGASCGGLTRDEIAEARRLLSEPASDEAPSLTPAHLRPPHRAKPRHFSSRASTNSSA